MRKSVLAVGVLALSLRAAQASGYTEFVTALSVQDTNDALAVQHYTAALADPAFLPSLRPVALYNRGLAYDRLEKADLALADFSASLSLHPDFDTYTVRAHVYWRMGKIDLALADYGAAVATRPEIDAGYLDRGAFLISLQRYPEALGDFNKIVELDPDYSDGFFWRSTVHRLMGNYSAAMDDADEVVHLTHGKSAIGYAARAAVYVDEGRLDRALDAADDALSDDPHDVALLLQNVGLQWQLKKYQKALKTLDRAVAEAPANAYVVLWQTIVRADAVVPDTDLVARAARVDLAKWPGPVVKLYTGATDIDGVMHEANADPEAAAGRTCEANFYVAEWQRLHSHADAEKPLLQAAAADCPVEYAEKQIAASLLRPPT